MGISVLDQHIEITPGIAGGKPRIAGRRITVQDVVIWHERQGRPVDEITSEYDLTLSEVYAALTYYFDHRAEIDAQMEASQEFVESLRQTIPSKLGSKSRVHAD